MATMGALYFNIRVLTTASLLLGVSTACATHNENALKTSLTESWAPAAAADTAAHDAAQVSSNADGDLTATTETASSAPDSTASKQPAPLAGEIADTAHLELQRLVALALAQNPAIQAEYAQYKAQVLAISRSRRLPEPKLSFGYFIRSVETRVGPQRARLGISQSFPWPTQLTAGADAASARARALSRRVDALALQIEREVAEAYFSLWEVRNERQVHREHLEVLRALSETTLARLKISTATVADQQQIDLAVIQLEDTLLGFDEAEQGALARLEGAVGKQHLGTIRTPQEVLSPQTPAESNDALLTALRNHPSLSSLELSALAFEKDASAKAAEGLPSFSLAADWIITEESEQPGVADSGKDAVMIGGSISLPLYFGSYKSEKKRALAQADAARFQRMRREQEAIALLFQLLSRFRNNARRIQLFDATLLPQAQAAYDSTLGSYAAGKSEIAQNLLAQQTLLQLRKEAILLQAQYAQDWARINELLARPLKTKALSTSALSSQPQQIAP